jgi:hypothetical protein
MNRMRPMGLPALLALGGLGLWGSSAAAQYVGGGTAYAPGHYYVVGPGSYGSGYYYAPRPVAGPYYAAPAPSGRPVPSRNSGLQPESLPAQIAEGIAPAPAAPRLGPPRSTGWWRGRMWRRTPRSW